MQPEFFVFGGLRLTSQQFKVVGFISEFTKRMVLYGFPGPKTPKNASNLVKEIYRFADYMIAECIKSGKKPSCTIGCFRCCYMLVKVTPLEVLSIINYLHSSLRPRVLSELQQRLVATDTITRGMDGIHKICAKIICPLLLDSECVVYPVRPLACRFYHSLNLSDCQLPFDDIDRSVTVRQDISGLSMGMFAGLTEGLKAVGMQTRLLELNAGMRVAMDDPALELKWLAGEPAFADAEFANANRVEDFHQKLLKELKEARHKFDDETLGDGELKTHMISLIGYDHQDRAA